MTTKEIRENMQNLGIYREEYEPTIKTYVGMKNQYSKLLKKAEQDDEWYQESTAAEGLKKSPLASAMESLRKDILSYEAALGLTPIGLRKLLKDRDNEKKAKRSGGIVLMPKAGERGAK